MRSVVLSPHLDDAVLSCWHVLTQPGDVRVVNVFAGMPRRTGGGWWDRLTGATDGARRMRERVAEDAAALRLAGRTPVNLRFLDAQYRRTRPAVRALCDRLEKLVARGDAIYAPAGLGGVPDHDAVRAAALVLAQRGHDVRFYADLPHAIRFGWPASVTGRAAAVDVDAYWAAMLERWWHGPAAPRIHSLDAAAQKAKRRALAAYRTQLPGLLALNAGLAAPEALRYEAIWMRGTGEGRGA